MLMNFIRGMITSETSNINNLTIKQPNKDTLFIRLFAESTEERLYIKRILITFSIMFTCELTVYNDIKIILNHASSELS